VNIHEKAIEKCTQSRTDTVTNPNQFSEWKTNTSRARDVKTRSKRRPSAVVGAARISRRVSVCNFTGETIGKPARPRGQITVYVTRAIVTRYWYRVVCARSAAYETPLGYHAHGQLGLLSAPHCVYYAYATCTMSTDKS